MSDKPEVDAHSGVETTGHEWDGIKELNNPLPRWWLWIFYACILWAIVYMVLMPAIPGLPGTGWNSPGLRNHSERANVAAAMASLEASRSANFERLANTDLAAVQNDPELFRFALAAGESAFGDNCATCHGSGAQGFAGYPNLRDDDWLWGGSVDAIKRTLTVGVRSEHPETRFSQMPAFGADGLLTRDEINDVTEFVLRVSGQENDGAASRRGADVFEAQCASCHGTNATGDRAQGAPDLTDQIWLYGGGRETIHETIWSSRYGVMPYWSDRLDEATIDALTVYVHSLGGGEAG